MSAEPPQARYPLAVTERVESIDVYNSQYSAGTGKF